MGATPVCTIDATGIHKPSFATALAYFAAGYQGIYGNDIQIAADDQDGEFLGLLAQGVDDTNSVAVATYNAYSPATAQGTGLSINVKINGLKRDVPTNSAVPVQIGGQAFLTVQNGLMNDGAGNQWALPASVTIPSTGAITVTASCLTQGAIQLAVGQSLTPINPTLGWLTAVTVADATPGAPAEVDAQLRLRQARSTALPSNTMLDGIEAAVLAVTGVVASLSRVYENDTPAPGIVDSFGNALPGNSIAVVVDGGDAMAVAQAIYGSKFACGTFGTTSETIVDSIGVGHIINFYFLSQPLVKWVVTIHPKSNYSTSTGALIQASMAAATNANGTGNNIQYLDFVSAARLIPTIQTISAALAAAAAAGDDATVASLAQQIATLNQLSTTYEVKGLQVARDLDGPGSADVVFAFNEAALIVVDPLGNPVDPMSVVITLV